MASFTSKRCPLIVLKERDFLNATELVPLDFIDLERGPHDLRSPALFTILHHVVDILAVREKGQGTAPSIALVGVSSEFPVFRGPSK